VPLFSRSKKFYKNEKHKGKRPIRRPRCRKEDNIKRDPKEIGSKEVNWSQLP
jgi:hypothetical protein